MTTDKMLKLLLLEKVKNREVDANFSKYDRRRILKDYVTLKKEFLSEYTKENLPNEE